MIKIDSDNAAIEKNIRLMEKRIEEYGGYLDPDLYITCENGEMSVEKHGFINPTKPLIALPTDLLLPAEAMKMGVKNDEMFMNPDKGALTEIQTEMAETMLDLYNLTTKIKNHKASCCWFTYQEAPEALEDLMSARAMNDNQNKFMKFTRGESDLDRDQFLCETYVKTRTIGYKNPDSEDDDAPQTKIMPIVDFINHHATGANFGFAKGFDDTQKDKEFLQIKDSRPLTNSNECFAYYNQMDTLDAFINYGFPDTSTNFVRSVPVEFSLPDGTVIAARGLMGANKKGKLNKTLAGLRPYIPPTIINTEERLEVSYFIIPCDAQTQHALRRVLRLFISNRAARKLNTNQIWAEVLKAEEIIVSTNVKFYQDLIMKCDQNLAKAPNASWEMTKMVARMQLEKLFKYHYEESHFTGEASTNAGAETEEFAAAE